MILCWVVFLGYEGPHLFRNFAPSSPIAPPGQGVPTPHPRRTVQPPRARAAQPHEQPREPRPARGHREQPRQRGRRRGPLAVLRSPLGRRRLLPAAAPVALVLGGISLLRGSGGKPRRRRRPRQRGRGWRRRRHRRWRRWRRGLPRPRRWRMKGGRRYLARRGPLLGCQRLRCQRQLGQRLGRGRGKGRRRRRRGRRRQGGGRGEGGGGAEGVAAPLLWVAPVLARGGQRLAMRPPLLLEASESLGAAPRLHRPTPHRRT